MKPSRWSLALHQALTHYRAMLASDHVPATRLDHYFIARRPPVEAVTFDGRRIDPWVLCRLGWWIRGARLELIRYGECHLAILVTYPGLDQPNVEVALKADSERRWLELEGVYLFDLKGGGLGACALWHCAMAAQGLGCTHIEVQASGAVTRDAAGDIGYYAWPRMGFDAPLRLGLLTRLADLAPEAARCRTVREVLALDKELWRQAAVTVPLRFDLSPESADVAYLRAYLSARGLLL